MATIDDDVSDTDSEDDNQTETNRDVIVESDEFKKRSEMENKLCPSLDELEKIADSTEIQINSKGFDYIDVAGIPIIMGTTLSTYLSHETNCNDLNKIIKNMPTSAAYDSYIAEHNTIFDSCEPSTFTVAGIISNISFKESEIINSLPAPTGNILKLICNFGSKMNPNYIPAAPMIKSKRGRKPTKNKTKSRRSNQGTNDCMDSQITAYIRHPDRKKTYNIKLSRNGSIHIPGASNRRILDLIKPIKILCLYVNENKELFTKGRSSSKQPTVSVMQKIFDIPVESKQIEPVGICSLMRNYKCKITCDDYRVDVQNLNRLLVQECIATNLLIVVKNFCAPTVCELISECLVKENVLSISDHTYNPDKSFSMNIKILHSVTEDKKSTIKLLKSGKINFDGCNSDIEAALLYLWIKYIYIKYFDQIIVHKDSVVNTFKRNDMTNISYEQIKFS